MECINFLPANFYVTENLPKISLFNEVNTRDVLEQWEQVHLSVIITTCMKISSQHHFQFPFLFSPPRSIPSVSLVNKAVVDYFFVELGVERHFEALRHFLLMEDGEFAQSLSDLLFEKVTHSLFFHAACVDSNFAQLFAFYGEDRRGHLGRWPFELLILHALNFLITVYGTK